MTVMIRGKPFSLLIHLALLITSSSCLGLENSRENSYLKDACSVTQYQDICIHSLASFSDKAKRNHSRWARAGVSVSIGEAKKVAQYLANLKTNENGRVLRRRNRAALSDCIESFQEALDNLHHSLDVLRNLSVTEFSSQMEDVTTWLSAALTDEDTCLDGFDENPGKTIKSLMNWVSKAAHVTSNALALLNKLSATGPGSLNGDDNLHFEHV